MELNAQAPPHLSRPREMVAAGLTGMGVQRQAPRYARPHDKTLNESRETIRKALETIHQQA